MKSSSKSSCPVVMPQAAAPEIRSKAALTGSGSRPQAEWCCRVQTGSAIAAAAVSSGSAAESFGCSSTVWLSSPVTVMQPVMDSAMASRSM